MLALSAGSDNSARLVRIRGSGLAPSSTDPAAAYGGSTTPPMTAPMTRVWGRALGALLCVPLAAAQTPPHLDGLIEADPAAGLLRGEVCLSRLPPQQTYAFLLNRGLNIREVRDTASGRNLGFRGSYDATGVGDATRYSVADNVGGEGFCVRYVGAYPVYDVDAGERSVADWKGQVAFDGRTVRATEQARFYPVVEDSTSGAPLDAVTYRLNVSCSGCASIYVNGSAPTVGPRAAFASDLPRPLLLYAGDFPFKTVGSVHFVGAEVSEGDAALVRAGMRTLGEAHEAYLDVPYQDEPAFLTFASVSRDGEIGRNSWAFVTWPTVAMDGRTPFSVLVDSTGGDRAFSPMVMDWMSHEMAHYYFGTRYSPRGPLKWLLLESTAEFMSLKALRAVRGAQTYGAALREHYRDAVAGGPVVPLDSLRDVDQIGNSYRYRLGPLLLVALEDYVGNDVVRRALAALVTDPPTAEVDYAELRERLTAAGAADTALDKFGTECLVRQVEEGCLASRYGEPATDLD